MRQTKGFIVTDYSVAEPDSVKTFMCLTCGFEADIDLADGSGDSDESADAVHTRFDGAHRANWLDESDSEMRSPDEWRSTLGIETGWEV